MSKATASALRPTQLPDIDLHCPTALADVFSHLRSGASILSESVAVDDHAQMLNPGYLDDRVATFADLVPVDVTFAPVREESGPLGAKSIAEPPLIPVAACVANAIHDALGIRQYRLPMTPERVWRSI